MRTKGKAPCKGNRQFDYTTKNILLPLQGEPSLAAIVPQGAALGCRLLPLRGDLGALTKLNRIYPNIFWFQFGCVWLEIILLACGKIGSNRKESVSEKITFFGVKPKNPHFCPENHPENTPKKPFFGCFFLPFVKSKPPFVKSKPPFVK